MRFIQIVICMIAVACGAYALARYTPPQRQAPPSYCSPGQVPIAVGAGYDEQHVLQIAVECESRKVWESSK